jgi:hypothetical protein
MRLFQSSRIAMARSVASWTNEAPRAITIGRSANLSPAAAQRGEVFPFTPARSQIGVSCLGRLAYHQRIVGSSLTGVDG